MSYDENENGKLIEGHEYDGIRELNNPLPRWWLGTFYITIIFAVIYYGYYELGNGPSHDQQLETAMSGYAQIQNTAQKNEEVVDIDAEIKKISENPAAMQMGKEGFEAQCFACHGKLGEGGIGPNLTDKFWIHNKGNANDILQALRKGFPDKGMPAWGEVIPVDKHLPIVAYVLSLKGTNPPNGKPPQGEPVE